jgi:hypothetical protein
MGAIKMRRDTNVIIVLVGLVGLGLVEMSGGDLNWIGGS